MGNQFHLLVEPLQTNLVAGMTWFLGIYTSRFNRRQKLCSHLQRALHDADRGRKWLWPSARIRT
jgi:hypothetical protein